TPATWSDYQTQGDETLTPARSKNTRIVTLDQIQTQKEVRIITSDPEINRVLGGGIVPGSIVLVAGEPGIGKSTLFLQAGLELQNYRVLYISGEESEQQIKMRAGRIA